MQVTLYIATHNITGLKYFGKSSLFHTKEDLQRSYKGSGTYWKRHLKEHGRDVSMEIFGTFNIDEVVEIALSFSRENDIVNSKEWANLILENGLDGRETGYSHTEDVKKKIGQKSKGRLHSSETKMIISEASKNRSDKTLNILREQKIGTIHIHHPLFLKGKLIKSYDFEDYENNGWLKGVKPKL